MVIGTDSLASNRNLNILDEMRTLQKNFPSIQTEQLLRWATLNGAIALNMHQTLGSFEKGKQPGILIINNINDKKLTQQSTVKRILN